MMQTNNYFMGRFFAIRAYKTGFALLCFIGLFLLSFSVVEAQTCSALSGVVNTYAPVSGIAGNTVTIGATSGASAPFAVGDYVLLIQMTGAPPPQAGSNMGKYELRKVTSLAGGVVLDGIVNSYTTSEKVQLVRAPNCPTGTVSATVTAKVWDGTTGGIVAIKGGTLTMNANIDASSTGFSVASAPFGATVTGTGTGIGSTDGRGFTGSGTGAGVGGGGIGGGGGDGGNNQGGDGGSIGGSGGAGLAETGQTIYSGQAGFGVGGGQGSRRSIVPINGAGGGGGGGVIGGGGGGGGGNYGDNFTTNGAGGGGGVTGGGGGGYRNITAIAGTGASGGGGGGSMGVGNGASANYTDSGSGSGGGSYGGGGGSASALAGGDDSYGGGGGGSWTGGGIGGTFGTAPFNNIFEAGANGNDPVSVVIPNSAHYLNTTQARMMLGGGGGNSICRNGGLGGGVIFLEFTNVSGNNFSILANGEAPLIAPATCVGKGANEGSGGAGGGGGGQMVLNVKNFTSLTTIEAKGGKGGDANYNAAGSGLLWHGGVGGAGGGGGGIWVYGATSSSNTGSETVTIANTNLSGTGATLAGVAGGNSGARTTNPKNSSLTGTGGAGGNGLIIQSPTPSWPLDPCAITAFTVTPVCNNAGTTATATDDYRTFSLTLAGTGTAATYSASVNSGGMVTPTTGTYGTATAFQLQAGSAGNATTYTITITDGTSGTCTQTATISDTGACSTPPPVGCTTITNNTNVEVISETEISVTNNTSSHALQVNCAVTYDWGDNPDTGAGSGAGNYLTSTADNGPRHIIVTGLKLGATVDAETDGQPTGTLSTGDDTTGAPDDEDSVTIPTLPETVATTLNFTLMNMTGTAAKLCGWIDFNKNGVYDNTTERQCTNVADAATTATLSFTAPVGSAGTTYARFRLSTDAAFLTAMESTGEATSGEVEDYQVTITAGCAINTPTIVATCGNNGTPSDPADDTFTFTISATGTAAGASYKVDKTAPAPTATVFPTVNYGTTSAASSAFPISGGALTLTLTDNTTPTCTLTPVTVTPPATCSGTVATADLELTKVADKTQVRVGDTLTYTLRLENKGPGSASGIKVRDLVPAGLTFVSATPSVGTYTSATGIWDVGTLTNGQVVTLTIVTTVQ